MDVMHWSLQHETESSVWQCSPLLSVGSNCWTHLELQSLTAWWWW